MDYYLYTDGIRAEFNYCYYDFFIHFLCSVRDSAREVFPNTSIVVTISILPINLLSPGGPFTKIFMFYVCILPNRYIIEQVKF